MKKIIYPTGINLPFAFELLEDETNKQCCYQRPIGCVNELSRIKGMVRVVLMF